MSMEVKQHLLSHINDLLELLKSYGYGKFNVNDTEIRCSKPHSDNGTTCRIRLNSYLSCTDFSSAYNGDLFGMITCHTDVSYVKIIERCYELFSIENGDVFEDFNESFDLFEDDYEETIPIYNEAELEKFKQIWNMRVVKDNIMPKTQEMFSIGYDYKSKRITIPWRDIDGNLIGVMGRADYDNYGDFKYIPILRFKKRHSMFGIYKNKEFIKNNRVYIGESEKFVLQLHTMGVHNALALGGNSIDKHRLGLLEQLNVREIVFCFDEGLEVEVQKRALKTTKKYFKNEVKIGVMYDKHNKYLPKDSKYSPSDLGKQVWEGLVSDCIRWMK